MGRFTGVLGMLAMLGLAYLFSADRRAIRLKTVLWGLGLQIALAFFVLRFATGRLLIEKAANAITTLLGYSFAGSEFVFGELGKQHSSLGLIFAFQVLPATIFVAALFALLYYLGVMQIFVRAAAWVMQRVMVTSGAESLDVAASIFMGQTEAPLTIRPFLADLTRSELMTVMTAGMAHVSGAMMVAYIAFGADAKHLITAVIMTAPGTLLMAKMLVPETGTPRTAGTVKMDHGERDANFLAAIARGTADGLYLALNVAAMLIAFLGLIYLLNGLMGGVHNWLAAHGIHAFPSSLQQIFGWVFAPVVAHWHSVERLHRHWQPAGRAHGAE
jgi:concentrative nucleoside transporter, CNT family